MVVTQNRNALALVTGRSIEGFVVSGPGFSELCSECFQKID